MKVLDSTAFIRLDFPHLIETSINFITTPNVVDEIRDFKSKMNLEILISSDRLLIREAELTIIKRVKNKAKQINLHHRLSETDISVLALALQKNCVLITNDIAMQLLARKINVSTEVISGKHI